MGWDNRFRVWRWVETAYVSGWIKDKGFFSENEASEYTRGISGIAVYIRVGANPERLHREQKQGNV